MKTEYKNNLGTWSRISLILSFIFMGMGFYKMYMYSNPESYYLKPTNVYVGGDAYNYIINANYSTAFFTLACTFMIASVGCLIASFLYDIKYNSEVKYKPIITSNSQIPSNQSSITESQTLQYEYDTGLKDNPSSSKFSTADSIGIAIIVIVFIGALYWYQNIYI